MKTLLALAAAGGILAGSVPVTASAQPDWRDHHRYDHGDRHRHWDRDRHDGWRGHRAGYYAWHGRQWGHRAWECHWRYHHRVCAYRYW